MITIPEELIPALQGVVPSQIVTVDQNNMSNTTIISQVYQVDDNHVAISNQFFSKTFKNLEHNKKATVQVWHPGDFTNWLLYLELVRVEKEGSLFDEMEMQLEAIATMTGMQDVFKLQSAYVFKVITIKHLAEAQS